MLTVFFSTISYSAYHFIPGPVVPAATTQAILEIKRIVPKHSAMLTWWDYGYPLMEIGEFATYHNNGLNGKIRSTLIAKALTSPHQADIPALISNLETYGFKRLNKMVTEKNLSGEQLMEKVFNHPVNMTKDNIYVLYTDDMVKTFGNISTIGSWDFDKKTSDWKGYALLTYYSQANNVITFQGGRIDLTQGIIFEGAIAVPLLAVLFIEDGYVIDRMNYAADKGVYLQVLLKKNQIPRLQVLGEPVFRSNFNQQFILGNFDRRYFEEVYNNFPVARVLKVKPVAGQ
jgi:dolichyl-diphosphooligosaccharide--protein glycosyltransferase